MKEVVENYFKMSIPQKKRIRGMSVLQNLIKKCWPSETTLDKMKNRLIDVNRKTMILLYMLTEHFDVEVVDDEEEGAKDAIEKYADKVIEKEYQKLDHDVDDDDEGFEDVGEEEEGEDVDDVMEEEEGEDEGDFFGKEGTLESEDEEEVEDEDEPKKISKK